MSNDWSDVKIDHVGFKLKAIIDEWAKEHRYNALGGGTNLPPSYYVEINGEPLDQEIDELRLIFYEPQQESLDE